MSSVIADLEQWGPDGKSRPLELSAARSYTWELATSHYENFPVVSWAVPKPLRQHFANVYAFCRWADDLGDETGSSEKSLQLLDWWQSELERCYHGDVRHPVYVALLETVQQFAIPIDLFLDLISAFIQDQTVTEYKTRAELLDYCRRSANPVGRIVLCLCQRSSEENCRNSDAICTGLQLANFWQDVSRDYDLGRVYLPEEDRLRFHYSHSDMQARTTSPQFRELMSYEIEEARRLLTLGKPLVAAMLGRMKIDIDLFVRGGLLVLDGIERINYDVWSQRPVVKKRQLFTAGVKSFLNCSFFTL